MYELIGGLHLRHALHLLSYVPFCQHGSLRVIAVLTQEAVITRSLRPVQRAVIPPPALLPIPTKQRALGWPKTSAPQGCLWWPPSTKIEAPVIKSLSLAARKMTVPTKSAGY